MTTALGLLLAVRALSVTLDPCLGDSAAELDRMIATEVTDFAEVVPDSQATLHAALSCDGETILIELSDPATGRSSARRVGEGRPGPPGTTCSPSSSPRWSPRTTRLPPPPRSSSSQW